MKYFLILLLQLGVTHIALPVLAQTSPSYTGDNFDLKYHRLTFEVDPAVNSLKGSATSYFIVKSGSPTINFDLDIEMIVDSVVYHSSKVNYTHASNILSISVPLTVSIQPDSVAIYYQGIPAKGANFMHQFDGSPLFFTDSEPYGSQGWWPCKENLNDKIDSVDIIVTTPYPYKVASNGILISEHTASGKTTFHWKHRYPITTYLIAFAVSDYQVYSQSIPLYSGGNLDYTNYIFAQQTELPTDSLDRMIPYVQYYDSLLGPYPFKKEKFGYAEAYTGMENQTMVFMTQYSDEVGSHELAHQWFGDKVTCSSWRYLWLNEGFATYMTDVAYERLKGKKAGVHYRDYMHNVILANATDNAHIIPSDTLYPFILDVYYKGAFVLHMLRKKIGDEAFFQGLRNYLNDPSRAYSFATIDHFKQHMEGTSGLDLTVFFNEWVEGSGYPDINVKWNQLPDNTVNIKFEQIQTLVNYYHDVPIQISFRDVNYNIVYDTVINPIQGHEYFSFNHGVAFDRIELNNDFDVLAHFNLISDPTLNIIPVQISTTVSNPTSATSIPVRVLFLDGITDFDVNDLVINNATVSNFSSGGDGYNYTFTLTPITYGEVSVTVPGNCVLNSNNRINAQATLVLMYQSTTGISIDQHSDIKVYPVPATTSLTVMSQNKNIERYELYDMQGEIVNAITLDTNTGFVDLSGCTPGVYVLTLYMEGGSIERERIIVK